MLNRSMGYLADKLLAHNPTRVRLTRGGASVVFYAMIGKTESEQDNGFGVITRYVTRDYLGKPSDIVLDGEPTLPQTGDIVTELDTAGQPAYEVLSIPNVGPFRRSDPFGHLIRIHTKDAVEPAE